MKTILVAVLAVVLTGCIAQPFSVENVADLGLDSGLPEQVARQADLSDAGAVPEAAVQQMSHLQAKAPVQEAGVPEAAVVHDAGMVLMPEASAPETGPATCDGCVDLFGRCHLMATETVSVCGQPGAQCQDCNLMGYGPQECTSLGYCAPVGDR